MTLIASSRMYDVNPGVARIWAELFGAISELADVPVEMLSYPAPLPIDALWARADMGLVFMCGWPFSRSPHHPALLAAPVPDDPHAKGRPVYWTDMIVRADAPFLKIEDTFGQRIAWTIKGSHSGYNAPRRLLMDHAIQRGAPLYGEVIGDVISPMGAIKSVLEGRADVAPLDGFFHVLLKRHDPELAQELRVIARTEVAPMPVLVASKDLPDHTLGALRAALITAHDVPKIATFLRRLCITSCVVPDIRAYALGDQWETEAHAAGYPDIV